jgi:hypothetical protein
MSSPLKKKRSPPLPLVPYVYAYNRTLCSSGLFLSLPPGLEVVSRFCKARFSIN